MHVAMENMGVRENGFVLITNVREVKLRHFDTSSRLAVARSDLDLPIRRQNIHICNPPIWKAVGSFYSHLCYTMGRMSKHCRVLLPSRCQVLVYQEAWEES